MAHSSSLQDNPLDAMSDGSLDDLTDYWDSSLRDRTNSFTPTLTFIRPFPPSLRFGQTLSYFSVSSDLLNRRDESSIFVKNLESVADETTLRSIFSEFGTILSCKVVKDEFGNSKRFGFVNFASHESADRAVRECNVRPFYGRKLIVQLKGERKPSVGDPRKDSQLYVKFLSDEYKTEDRLRALFEPFGDITYNKVATDDSGRPKDYGYVSFANSAVADNACRILNGMPVGNGQELVVKRAHTREEMTLLKSGDWKICQCRVFVDNLDKTVDDQMLSETFSKFGKILSSRVALNELGYSRGHGSVVFFNESDADRAITEANGMTLNGNKISVKPYESKCNRQPLVRKTAKKSEDKSDIARKVFVNKLIKPIDTEPALKTFFSLIGEVTEVKIVTDSNGVSKGYAIVTFADMATAEEARRLCNPMMFGGIRILVKKYQTKEEILAQLKRNQFIECQICYDNISRTKAISYGCEHRFCSVCVRKSLETLIEEGMIESLECPDPECGRKADQQLVMKLVSKSMFSRFERLSVLEAIKDMEDIIYCPTPNCGALIETEPQLLRAECRKCTLVYCTSCMKKYHGLSDCPLTDEQKRQMDQLSESFVEKTFRKCPKCKSSIEKNGGCDHMTCKCGHQFCWLCSNTWALEHNCTSSESLASDLF